MSKKKMRTIYRDCAVGLIVSKDNKFLFGKKDPEGGGVYVDCWHLPGGGIDDGETDEAALTREMREEVGIDISNANVSLLDDKGQGVSEKTLKDTGEVVLCQMKFKVFRIDIDSNAADISVTPGDDIQTTTWTEPGKLSDYKLTPPSVKLFTRLGYLGPTPTA
jgi:8-oxo-dGTP pyrophosphatase MutT (NUDIX family)